MGVGTQIALIVDYIVRDVAVALNILQEEGEEFRVHKELEIGLYDIQAPNKYPCND